MLICLPRFSSGLARCGLLLAFCSPSLGQTEDFKFVGSGSQPTDANGHAVDMDSDYIVIGARDAVTGGVDIGAAYVLDRATGLELYKLVPSDGVSYDKFGYSVAVENGIALIGSPHHSVGSSPKVGVVYIYDLSSGLEIGRLLPATMDYNGHFGIGVALEGSLAAVGGHTRDTAAVDSGEVGVFDWVTGTQLHSLVAVDATQGDRLGWTVAMDGGLVLAGANYDDQAGPDAGSAYVFDANTGVQVHKLLPASVVSGDLFGWKVAMENGLAVIGAHQQDLIGANNCGAIYLFDAINGTELMHLHAPDGEANDHFGFSVNLNGGYVVVGAEASDTAGKDAGAVYVLDVLSGAQQFKVMASDASRNDLFGSAVCVDGTTLLVGGTGVDDGGNNAGAAYQYDLSSCGVRYCGASTGSPLNKANLNANSCQLTNPINLILSNAPQGQFTYLLIGSGNSTVNNPAGALGDLCVVGGFLSRYRLDLGAISTAGTFSTDISDSNSGGSGFGIPSSGGAAIQAGQTWHFQYWHRMPGGAPSSFSEALAITFQ